jgi:predicted aminopeptidase
MHSTLFRVLWAASAVLCILLFATFNSGCQTIGYYSQAATGQLRVLSGREPVTRVMAQLDARRSDDPEAAKLYERLAFTQRVLEFSEAQLQLPVGDRYRTYVELNRSAVTWNVFAAPSLSLRPRRWCYPLVGCAPYRGYFNEEAARRQAAALERAGFETYVAPVAAYSTLGWFADPLMSSFIAWPEPNLAELLFHELAHGVVWVPGDVAFNEAFATFVGRQGLAQWLEASGDHEGELRQQEARALWRRMLSLLEQTRQALVGVYRSHLPDAEKERLKGEVMLASRACYSEHRDKLGHGRYDALMFGLNNARLASIATYEDLVPAFAALFESVDGSWPDFFGRVRALVEQERVPAAWLRASADELSRHQQEAEGADDRRSHQIECEALSRHFLYREFAGREHDDVGRGGDGEHERAGSAHGGGDHEQLRVHAGAQGAGSQNGHEQRGGGRVAGRLGQEGHAQADAEHHHQNVQGGESREQGADGLAQA